MKRTVGLSALAGLALSAAAFGQVGTGFTITDGTTIYVQGDTPTLNTSAGPLTDLRVGGPASNDQTFRNYWWYRMDPAGGLGLRENTFSNQTGPTVVAGNTATQNYTFAGDFTTSLTYVATALSPTSGMITETLVITPLRDGTLNIFNYFDFFISNADASDLAIIAMPGLIVARDTVTNQHLTFQGAGSTRFHAGAFGSMLNQLTDTGLDDATNTNSAVAGDIEGVLQWQLPVVAGQPITIVERIIVPAPGAAALLGVGGLVAIRRRR